jgi:murein DD-endopeptidase MepM/ murein hydrolase activator NlpD
VTKFIYNPKTCRYEREGINLWRITGYIALVIFFSSLTFVGIASFHALLFESEEEATLRSENKALDHHYALVKRQYVESENQLAALEEKDNALKASLFNSIFSETTAPAKQRESYIDIANLSKLRKSISRLTDRTRELKVDASFNSEYFGEKLSGDRKATLHTLSTTPSILPVVDGKLISGFGKRIHPFHKGLYEHPGIDIAAVRGTEVVATANGVVSDLVHSDLLAGYGNFVELSHNSKMSTRYAHLETILVKQGQKIKKGQVIGTVGNSGGSIAPHLHYEVLRNGKEQNPIYYLLQNIDPGTYQNLYTISNKQNQSLD